MQIMFLAIILRFFSPSYYQPELMTQQQNKQALRRIVQECVP